MSFIKFWNEIEIEVDNELRELLVEREQTESEPPHQRRTPENREVISDGMKRYKRKQSATVEELQDLQWT